MQDNVCVSEPKKSPFDFDKHTMLYVSNKLPCPNKHNRNKYRNEAISEIVKLLEVTHGKTLILFTAKDDRDYVFKKLSNMGLPYKIMVQSSDSSQEHRLERFQNNVNSVILGTGAYLEGINIKGESLSQVIIFKLPFPVPDPITEYTKVQTDFDQFLNETERSGFKYVIPDFRLNKLFDKLDALSPVQKDKVEFLCNECCSFYCKDRKACYEIVSRKNLGENCPEHICTAPDAKDGYRFSKAMRNPGFISTDDIINTYLPLGFSNFKIEGRGLGSAVNLEFLLYYLIKPEYQLNVREEIYLDSMLDLF